MIKKIIILMLFLLLSPCIYANQFRIQELTSKQQATIKKSNIWRAKCPTALADLRLLSISYYDLLGKVHHNGELIVHQSAAQHTLDLFKNLYSLKFPFSSVESLIKFKGNIQRAEEKNITYAFTCHREGKKEFSVSSSGKVITINPVFNPEIKFITNKELVVVKPNAGIFSINRNLKLKGMTEAIQEELNNQHFFPLISKENKINWKQFVYLEDAKNIKNTSSDNQTIVKQNTMSPVFSARYLTSIEMNNFKKNNGWNDRCPVPLNRLNLLTLSYYGLDKQPHIGSLIIFDGMASFTIELFKELFDKKIILEKFDVNGTSENEDTSAFNCRMILNSNRYSLHAYGLAIDINAWHNPYIGAYHLKNKQMLGALTPASAVSFNYLNRSINNPASNEKIVSTLNKHGFIEWGGDWQDPIDYMHFQVPQNAAKHLVLLDKETAEEFIKVMIQYPDEIKKMSADPQWDKLYKLYPKHYIPTLKKYLPLFGNKNEKEIFQEIYSELTLKNLG